MKVLIAEDDRVSRRLLQGLLEKWGYEVVAAADGAEGWLRFQEGDFPLVITDWMMGEVDGLELIRRIRASQRPGYVYAILLTSLSQKKDVVQGMAAGADDFVTKPFDLEELRARLQAGERVIRLERTLIEQNRQLRETQAALIQSQNLASVSQLAAGMAHEINNPLGFVINNLAVLRRDTLSLLSVLDVYRGARDLLARAEPALAAEAARIEEEIELDYVSTNLPRLLDSSTEGLRRVSEIVNNLRDFARLDEAEFKEDDLNAGLVSTLKVLSSEVETREIDLERDLGPIPAIYCCPAKIDQLFLNLVLNAVQACEPGGKVGVKTWLEPGPDPDGGNVLVEVRDSGHGIAPEHLPHIFEPFFTTKAVGLGKGLGLSVSYGIVRDHGGAIEVESAPGRGSVFRARLPVKSGIAGQRLGTASLTRKYK
jgi:two-component system NtrC family sensor kinase